MKITQKKSNKNKYILLALTLLCVGLIAGSAYLWSRKDTDASAADTTTQPMNEVNYDPPTEEEQTATEDRKEEIIKEQEKEQDQKDPPPAANNIAITIVRAAQAGAQPEEQAGKALNIRTIIDGTSSGTCQVTLTKSGQNTVQKTFPIVFDATSATCDNADIAASDFGASGEWELSIIAIKDGTQSKAASRKVIIQK